MEKRVGDDLVEGHRGALSDECLGSFIAELGPDALEDPCPSLLGAGELGDPRLERYVYQAPHRTRVSSP